MKKIVMLMVLALSIASCGTCCKTKSNCNKEKDCDKSACSKEKQDCKSKCDKGTPAQPEQKQ